MKHPSYAILYKAYTNDGFVRRRIEALMRCSGVGDVYLMLDETRRSLGPVRFRRTLRYQESDLLARGFANSPAGQLFWYNCDYPLYEAYERLPKYDYYLMLDWDAVAQCDLDALVARAAADGIDYIGEPITTPLEEWPWLNSCRDAYPEGMPVHAHMICVALFSRRAVEHLMARRLALSADWRAGRIREWPISEAFLPTEMAHGGFAMGELSTYTSRPRVSWWPPYHEAQLRLLRTHAFVHPVLGGHRYLRSLLRNGPRAALRAWWQMAVSDLPPDPL
jgi:hypothetical protein